MGIYFFIFLNKRVGGGGGGKSKVTISFLCLYYVVWPVLLMCVNPSDSVAPIFLLHKPLSASCLA